MENHREGGLRRDDKSSAQQRPGERDRGAVERGTGRQREPRRTGPAGGPAGAAESGRGGGNGVSWPRPLSTDSGGTRFAQRGATEAGADGWGRARGPEPSAAH